MTSTTAATHPSPLSGSDHELARRALLPTAIASVVVALTFEWMRSDTPGEAVSMTVLVLVAAPLLFALAVPRGLRHDSAGGRALALGLVALVLVFPAFWSQLPLLLGVSAVLLGYAGKRAATGSGTSIAGLVLGTLAVVGYLAIFVGDWIAHPGAGWLLK